MPQLHDAEAAALVRLVPLHPTLLKQRLSPIARCRPPSSTPLLRLGRQAVAVARCSTIPPTTLRISRGTTWWHGFGVLSVWRCAELRRSSVVPDVRSCLLHHLIPSSIPSRASSMRREPALSRSVTVTRVRRHPALSHLVTVTGVRWCCHLPSSGCLPLGRSYHPAAAAN